MSGLHYQLRRHQTLHSVKLIHNGAKPANFCLPPGPFDASQSSPDNSIFMIDFGFSSFYTPPPDGEEKDKDWATANWFFRSLRSEGGFSKSEIAEKTKSYLTDRVLGVSPRDDLESLTYVLAYLGKGMLPWHGGPVRPRSSKQDAAGDMIFEGMDPVYQWLFDISRKLEWGKLPDYDHIIAKFSERWVEKGFGPNPGEFNWWFPCADSETAPDETKKRRWYYRGWSVFSPGETNNRNLYEPPLPLPQDVALPDENLVEILFLWPERKRLPKPDAEERQYLRQGMSALEVPLPLAHENEWKFLDEANCYWVSVPPWGTIPLSMLENWAKYPEEYLEALAAFYDLEEYQAPEPELWNPHERPPLPKPDVAELMFLIFGGDDSAIPVSCRVPLPNPDFEEYLWFFVGNPDPNPQVYRRY